MKFMVFAVAATLASLAGCSSSEVVRQVDITIGQQLIDLKQAKDSGALSASEYDSQRRTLIQNVK